MSDEFRPHTRSPKEAPKGRVPLSLQLLSLAASLVLVLGAATFLASSATAKVICEPQPQCEEGILTASVVAIPGPDEVHNAADVYGSAQGGSAPYSYSYSGLPSGCGSEDKTEFACTPSAVGNYELEITVHDSKGATATSSYTWNVYAPTVGLSISPNPVLVTNSVTLTATPSLTTGTLTYKWASLPGGCSAPSSDTVASFSCTPLASNGLADTNYAPEVTVTDSDGNSASYTAQLTVADPMPGPQGGMYVSPNPLLPNTPTTISANIVGWAGSVTFGWSGFANICTPPTTNTVSSFTCTPTAPVQTTLYATITVTQGSAEVVVQENAQLDVYSSLPESGPLEVQVLGTAGSTMLCGTTVGMENGVPGSCDSEPSSGNVNSGLNALLSIMPSGGDSPYSGWWEWAAGGGDYPVGGAHSFADIIGNLNIYGMPIYPGVNTLFVGINDSGGHQLLLSNDALITFDGSQPPPPPYSCNFPQQASGWVGFSLYFPECSESAVEGAIAAADQVDAMIELISFIATFGIADLVELVAEAIVITYEATIEADFNAGSGFSMLITYVAPAPVPVAGEPPSVYTSWGI